MTPLPKDTEAVSPDARKWYTPAQANAQGLTIRYARVKGGKYRRMRRGWETNKNGMQHASVCAQHIETIARERVFGKEEA